MQKIDGRKWKLKWVEFGVRGGENGVDYKAEHVLCSCAEHVFNGMFFLWERNAFMGQSNIDTKKNCYSSFPIFISLFSHYACVWLHFYSSFSNWLLTLHLNYVNWKKNWNNFGWFSNELIRFLNWLLSGLLYSGLELCFVLIWFFFLKKKF